MKHLKLKFLLSKTLDPIKRIYFLVAIQREHHPFRVILIPIPIITRITRITRHSLVGTAIDLLVSIQLFLRTHHSLLSHHPAPALHTLAEPPKLLFLKTLEAS